MRYAFENLPPRTLCAALALALALNGTAHAAPADGDADAPSASATTSSPPQDELGTIRVIGVAPQQGAELPVNEVPYNVQNATAGDLSQSQALDATDYLNRRMAGVSLNSTQDNPLQPDLNFRGFTATPLLGGSEGLSVYVDGVRVNEVFGDTVNWDLIPEESMAKMTLLSGANPIFGLNTLGGAVLIETKNGFTDPGTHVEFQGGSFGRTNTTFETGGNNGTWGWYVLANHFEEDGWRDLSTSNAASVLGTLSWRSDRASLDLHLSHVETKLIGDGGQSLDILDLAPTSVFTAPDLTQNFYTGITAQGKFKLDDETLLSATVFGRQVDTRSYNGDTTDFDTCDDNDDILCGDDGNPVLDQHGNPVSSDYNAVNSVGVRKQFSWGGSLQAVFKQPLFGMKNQFVVGLDYDHGRVNYDSYTEASYLIQDTSDPYSNSTAANTGVFVPDDAMAVHIEELNEGVYLTDTLSLTDKLSVTLSGRYNHTHTTIADTSGENPALDGDHTFHRFNPAAGLTYQFDRALNFYGGYSQSTRAPTPVELTCASPDAPCKLPNDFVDDPDLKQVVAHSIEAGFRGEIDVLGGPMHWQAGVYRTINEDDITFQVTGGSQSNEGFYANVGDTRRQGVEIAFNGKAFDNRLDWFVNYALVDATFRTPFTETSAHHPDADDDGQIQIVKGDRIPGIPRNQLKAGADWHITRSLSVGADAVYNSSQYYRGDEANLLAPLGGYTVVNLRGSYRINDYWSLFARVENLFDRHFYNFGSLGDATDIFPSVTDPRFVSPGSPRGAWVGVSLDF